MAVSEEPLFQHTDEQEAAYAPQQLPEESAPGHRADLEATGSDTPPQELVVPAAVAGVARTASGISYTSGLSHNTEPGGIRPRGAEALTAQTEQDEDTTGGST